MKQEPVSIVESKREEELRIARARTAAAQALFEEQYGTEARKKRIQKICLIGFVLLLGVALLSSLIWLIVSIFSNTPSAPSSFDPENSDDNPTIPSDLSVVEGYSCTTVNCLKITNLTDHSILVRDGDAYFIRDRAANISARTTIKEQEYRAIIPFGWGSELLVSLDPNTGRSAIYSITRNRQISTFSYDAFLVDPTNSAYSGMTWIIGKYILATQGSETRLLDVFDGKELVRATSKIFAYYPFLFGHELSGERRAYTDSGARIITTSSDEFLCIKDTYLVHVKNKTAVTIYDSSGVKLQASSEDHKALLQRLNNAKSKDYAATLATFPDIFVVPN